MAGYGTVEKKEVSVVARIVGDQAGKLADALQEAVELEGGEVEGRYEVLASEALGEQPAPEEHGEAPDGEAPETVDPASGASATPSWHRLLREPEFAEEDLEEAL